MTETNLNFEKYEEIISLEELQNFINDDAQNVPKMRRDLKQLDNVTWLLRNLHFKNKDIPRKYLIALTKLADKLTKN